MYPSLPLALGMLSGEAANPGHSSRSLLRWFEMTGFLIRWIWDANPLWAFFSLSCLCVRLEKQHGFRGHVFMN